MPVFLVAAFYAIGSTVGVLTGDLNPSETGVFCIRFAYGYTFGFAFAKTLEAMFTRKEKSND